ncbi:MAG: hypothetical protein K6U74_15400, partial [Firmicutes bacterium]|nr:hypothetical protein [Bacillota bacterium]
MNSIGFWREEHRWFALFSMSAFIMAVETAFTRLFSVINWAEYGYFVISIVMAGFALSGVLLAIFPRFFTRYGGLLLEIVPVILVAVIALSYWGVCAIDFNPYELQNETLWKNQLPKIGGYYLCLFPFFFLCGLYVGLNFMIFSDNSGFVYGYNMIGSAIGSVFVLLLMYIIHPFRLVGTAVFLLTTTLIFTIPFSFLKKYTRKIVSIALICLSILVGIILCQVKIAKFPFYKQIYTALVTEGNRVIKEIFSPRGYFQEVDNVTEYNRLDLSNNYETLGCGSPPRSYGLYRDGQRITAIKKGECTDYSYLKGALNSFPYLGRRAPRCLLIGTNGGFRVRELQELGAGEIVALEQGRETYRLITEDHAPANASFLKDPRVRILQKSPLSYLAGRPRRFDVIELSLEELNAFDSSKYLVTVEAVKLYYESLSPSGLLAIPVSIGQLTVYALKMLENVRTALIRSGIREPWKHIAVYRTSWTAMVLVSKRPLGGADIRALRNFCNDRSFDVSFYPGIEADRVEVWNELPPVSLEEMTYEAGKGGPRDALREEALQLLRGDAASFLADNFFDLRPSTLDRPGFYGILRFNRLGRILARISAIPQEEIGGLINYAV